MKRFLKLFSLTFLLVLIAAWIPGSFQAIRSSSLSTAAVPLVKFDVGEKHRGMSWTGEAKPITAQNFDSLVDAHVNWIVQTPFGWQQDYNIPDLSFDTQNSYWGETEEGLRITTQLARERGIETLLKPHIWLINRTDGKWRTEIDMASEAEWQTWFQNYRAFMLHYAKFAQQNQIKILCIGTELQNPAVEREADWRQLIADIRKVYSGKLTYAANWHDAFQQIKFWDALDFIGIQAYFPLTQDATPSVQELISGWQPHLKAIATVQSQYQKPVLFTEIGYRSDAEAAVNPWKWPETSEVNPSIFATDVGLDIQARCYEAFFKVVWTQDWFAGAYWWKWMPSIAQNDRKIGAGFTPQNKPAETILKKWYRQAASAA